MKNLYNNSKAKSQFENKVATFIKLIKYLYKKIKMFYLTQNKIFKFNKKNNYFNKVMLDFNNSNTYHQNHNNHQISKIKIKNKFNH